MFKTVCAQVGLDPNKDKVSATSCRKGLIQTGVEADVPGSFLSKMLGQKNLDSKLEYLKVKENSHKAASLVINRNMSGKNNEGFAKIFKNLKEGDVASIIKISLLKLTNLALVWKKKFKLSATADIAYEYICHAS